MFYELQKSNSALMSKRATWARTGFGPQGGMSCYKPASQFFLAGLGPRNVEHDDFFSMLFCLDVDASSKKISSEHIRTRFFGTDHCFLRDTYGPRVS